VYLERAKDSLTSLFFAYFHLVTWLKFLLAPLLLFPYEYQLKSLQQQGKPLTLGEKASTYGLMGVGGILGLVGVAISILKQFTTILG